MTGLAAIRGAVDLSNRDLAILHDLARVRLLTGSQLERLHFADIALRSRGGIRRRVLNRLIALGLVTTLPRPIGGVRAGSAGLVYILDAAGQRLLMTQRPSPRIRRPWSIGSRFVDHTLDVAELYVRLREQELAGALRLQHFAAEPASWHRADYVTLKPDAYAIWDTEDWEEHRWIEVDRSTESLPTLRRKLLTYAEAVANGVAAPRGVVPQVLLTVPDRKRLADLQALIVSFPNGERLFHVELFDTAFMVLPTDEIRPPP